MSRTEARSVASLKYARGCSYRRYGAVPDRVGLHLLSIIAGDSLVSRMSGVKLKAFNEPSFA